MSSSDASDLLRSATDVVRGARGDRRKLKFSPGKSAGLLLRLLAPSDLVDGGVSPSSLERTELYFFADLFDSTVLPTRRENEV